MIDAWTLLPFVTATAIGVWMLATSRERARCGEITRLRTHEHPSWDVRENGRAIRHDIYIGWDPKLYIMPMVHMARPPVPPTICAEEGCEALVGIRGARCYECVQRLIANDRDSDSPKADR